MDYLRESLSQIGSISLHWSSDCNMACKYCFIEKDKPHMMNFNKEIVEALSNGSFAQNIKKIFNTPEMIERIEDLSLWGAEPTINGAYFEPVILDLFDYFPRVNHFMFSTNALIGGEWIYEKFFIPMIKYCEEKERKIEFELQLSLDGPDEFNDDSRHPGATQNTLNAIDYIIDHLPKETKYFKTQLTTKATLDIAYMRVMNQRGIECFNWYFQFFNNVQQKALDKLDGRKFVKLHLNALPTLVDPGLYTIQDGKDFAQWIENLIDVNRNKLPTYNGMPLFFQMFSVVGMMLTYDSKLNPIVTGTNMMSCSAGKSNITIDYRGNIYTCNRLARNAALDKEYQTSSPMRANTNLFTGDKRWLMKMWGSTAFHNDVWAKRLIFDCQATAMAAAGQIDKKYFDNAHARTLLFYTCCGIWCHIGNEEDHTKSPFLFPTGILRLFGNGAIESMIKYTTISKQRGDFNPWKIVQLT